jgi:GDPmannose 4,6-dehydratase
MNRTCIITGVNGQLGQYFVKYLQENEPEIKIIGTIRHKSFEQQEYLFDREGVVFELMDLSDVHSIENLIIKYKPDYFLNFAANAIVPESWETPVQQMEVNFISVIHQLEAIRKHSPSTKYFNCGSSTEFAASKTPLSESSPLSPSSPYAVAKTAARNLIDIYRQRYGLYALQGWLFNFESKIRGEKYLTRKVTSNVGRIRKALKEGKNFNPLQLGNINGIRSYLH